MLEVRDLFVSYGPIKALEGVSIDVAAGSVVGIIGPNGAGKSTLMLTIAGVIQPNAGSIRLQGEDLTGTLPEDRVRAGLALVPEARHIFKMLTVEENLSLGGTIRNRDEVANDIGAILDLFPALVPYLKKPAGTLSGGEQQQLAIGRALLSKPSLLLLDEPSLGLSPQVVDIVFDAIAELKNNDATVVLVEQNAARTLDIADYVYTLQTGRVEAEGEAAKLRESVDLESIYLGKDEGRGAL